MTDEESYEIRLTNKALVFYFMAGATGLVLSFLAGVMVGRGVDAPGGDVQAARPAAAEEKVVTEETPRPAAAAEELTYAQRLESEKGDEGLDKPRPASRPAASPATPPSAAAPPPSVAKVPPATLAARPSPTPKPAASARSAPAAAGTFSIQVGAFKDKASADSVVSRLKSRGFEAYALGPGAPDGLFNVRVGSFSERPDAERVQARLRDQEKFKPFIVKN